MHPRAVVSTLVVLAALLGFSSWLATGPEATEAGQPCYRGWLLVGVLEAEPDLRLALLRAGGLPVGAPRESRIYVLPSAGSSSLVQDVRRLDYPVWAPGRSPAAFEAALQAAGFPVQAQPLCGGLGPAELGVPVVLASLGPGLLVLAWVGLRRRGGHVSDRARRVSA